MAFLVQNRWPWYLKRTPMGMVPQERQLVVACRRMHLPHLLPVLRVARCSLQQLVLHQLPKRRPQRPQPPSFLKATEKTKSWSGKQSKWPEMIWAGFDIQNLSKGHKLPGSSNLQGQVEAGNMCLVFQSVKICDRR